MKHWHAWQLGTASETRFVTWVLSHVSGKLCPGIDWKTIAGDLIKSQFTAICHKSDEGCGEQRMWLEKTSRIAI